MPTCTIYYRRDHDLGALRASNREFRQYLADALSGPERHLEPDEVSVRLLRVGGDGMIADVEAEILAYAYRERILRQDELCRSIAAFLRARLEPPTEVQVWLTLAELGHSWEPDQAGRRQPNANSPVTDPIDGPDAAAAARHAS